MNRRGNISECSGRREVFLGFTNRLRIPFGVVHADYSKVKALIRPTLLLAITALCLMEFVLHRQSSFIREFETALLMSQTALLVCLVVWCGAFVFLTFSLRDLLLIGQIFAVVAVYFVSQTEHHLSTDAAMLLFGVTLGKGARVALHCCGRRESTLTGGVGIEQSGLTFAVTFLIGLIILLTFTSWWHLEMMDNFYHGARWMGLWNNPNDYGMLMAAGVVLATGLLVSSRLSVVQSPESEIGDAKTVCRFKIHNSQSALLLFAVFMMGVGLVMSYSRGAWMAMAIGLLYLAKTYGRFKWRWILASVLLAMAVIWFFWNTPRTAPWYFQRLDLSRSSVQHRISAWMAGLEILRDNPFGVGWNKTVSTYQEHYSPPEGGAVAIATNDYLMLGTQLGTPALICFVVYVTLCLRSPKSEVHSPQSAVSGVRSAECEIKELRIPNSEFRIKIACRSAAIAMLVAFWFDGGLFKLATASVFWILLEMGAEPGFTAKRHRKHKGEDGSQNLKPETLKTETGQKSKVRSQNSLRSWRSCVAIRLAITNRGRLLAAKKRREHKELELHRQPPIVNRKSAISPYSALHTPIFETAFTLVELLVVIAIIGILAGLLLPVLARAKQKAQGSVCLNNMKQLQLSAILYGNNNNDDLPANVTLHNGGDSVSGKPNWTDGTYSSQPPWNNAIAEDPVGCATNPFYLGVQGNQGGGVTLLGSIGNYAKAAGVYRCPADQYLDPAWHAPRVRSCSANCFVGGAGPEANGVNGQQNGVNYMVFSKFSDFGGAGLSASDCFVYLDENPLSLNDGWFLFYGSGSTINDKPAINHGMSSSFSFADGHAEFQLWHDVFLDPGLIPGSTGASDTLWLAGHGTYPLQ